MHGSRRSGRARFYRNGFAAERAGQWLGGEQGAVNWPARQPPSKVSALSGLPATRASSRSCLIFNGIGATLHRGQRAAIPTPGWPRGPLEPSSSSSRPTLLRTAVQLCSRRLQPALNAGPSFRNITNHGSVRNALRPGRPDQQRRNLDVSALSWRNRNAYHESSSIFPCRQDRPGR